MAEGEISTELQKKPQVVKSFKTRQGSVYTYDNEGKTTRFKTATGEQMERQDVTIFANLTPDEEQQILHAYRHPLPEDKNSKVYVLERQQNDSIKIIRDIKDVTDPNRIYLGILNKGEWALIKKASITPTIGAKVFETRHYQKDGQWFTERHLGNKVTEVEYKNY